MPPFEPLQKKRLELGRRVLQRLGHDATRGDRHLGWASAFGRITQPQDACPLESVEPVAHRVTLNAPNGGNRLAPEPRDDSKIPGALWRSR